MATESTTLRITSETYNDGKILLNAEVERNGEVVQQLSRQMIDTMDKATRQALIWLGWTPPKSPVDSQRLEFPCMACKVKRWHQADTVEVYGSKGRFDIYRCETCGSIVDRPLMDCALERARNEQDRARNQSEGEGKG